MECNPATAGQSALLPGKEPLPTLGLSLAVELCPRGTEQKGQACQDCDIDFYSYNGTSCLACPEGALRWHPWAGLMLCSSCACL